MTWLLRLIAAAVLALFVVVWLWIGFAVLAFDPTTADPVRTFTVAQTTVAGFLSSAVGAGTASVLGIQVQRARAEGGRSLLHGFKAMSGNGFLVTGVATYAGVGVFVLMVWFGRSAASPDIVAAFAVGALGWLGGAFAAVFGKAVSG